MLSNNVGWFLYISFTFYSQLSGRLMIFGLQKQLASCGWQLIYANYLIRYIT